LDSKIYYKRFLNNKTTSNLAVQLKISLKQRTDAKKNQCPKFCTQQLFIPFVRRAPYFLAKCAGIRKFMVIIAEG
jgi:hypothetical protein